MASASEADLLKIQRKEVFEFTEKPTVTRAGDKVTISFAAKDFCDATVAIEDADGKIVRHLASGVLGANAPAPFQKGSLKQTIVWDGKNDKEAYVDDKNNHTIRVSLGLQPRFERTLYWSPHKLGNLSSLFAEPLTIRAAPEGVYVYDVGHTRNSSDPSLRLFDHDGNYLRTLYPFPAEDLEKVKGLKWANYPPDGRKFVQMWGMGQSDMLTHGHLELPTLAHGSFEDRRRALAVGKDYVYIVSKRLNRIAKPGSGKASDLEGPVTELVAPDADRVRPTAEAEFGRYVPTSAALSPDEKWLYLTGYCRAPVDGHYYEEVWPCLLRMPADGSEPPKLFIGQMDSKKERGTVAPPDGCVLDTPMSMACDKEGRIYVADHVKGVLVFSPDGKLLQATPVQWPVQVRVNPESGEIVVLCWLAVTAHVFGMTGIDVWNNDRKHPDNQFAIVRLSAFKDPDRAPAVLGTTTAECQPRYILKCHNQGEVDFFGKAPRVWFCTGYAGDKSRSAWDDINVRIHEFDGPRSKVIRNFAKDSRDAVTQSRPPRYGRQRPYFNPGDGMLYIAEQIQPTVVSDVQCFDQLVKIDPRTGRCSMVNLPFDTEDLAFDPDGLAYLRTESILTRYDSRDWREVPFDYGEEMDNVTHYGLKATKAISGTYFRGGRGASGKIFGMGVNVKGDLACSYYSTTVSSMEMAGDAAGNPDLKKAEANAARRGVKDWTPRIFPGRSTFAFIHVWDQHGKVKFEDAVPGLGEMSDVKIDKDDNLYMISNMNRLLDGQVHPNPFVDTLVKMPAGKGKILTDGKAAPIRLTEATRPNRPPDAIGIEGYQGRVWLEGAEWALAGIGSNARGLSAAACHCESNTGLALDYYGRSFAPALHRQEIVVVDTGGNVILRIGRCGNVEDGMPLIKDGGPANPRSIGGDEVAFLTPKWLTVDTDHRLFVTDRGNYRVLSVALGYHAEEKVELQGVPDRREAIR